MASCEVGFEMLYGAFRAFMSAAMGVGQIAKPSRRPARPWPLDVVAITTRLGWWGTRGAIEGGSQGEFVLGRDVREGVRRVKSM